MFFLYNRSLDYWHGYAHAQKQRNMLLLQHQQKHNEQLVIILLLLIEIYFNNYLKGRNFRGI